MEFQHEPVLASEVIHALGLPKKGVCVDATLGLGGHSEAILNLPGFQGRVLGLDRDQQSLSKARKRLERFGTRFKGYQKRFSEVQSVLQENGLVGVDGLLFDLGISSDQLESPERGFSFMSSQALDMRMNLEEGESAAEFISRASQEELEQVFWRYGEEPQARRIAQAIVRERGSRSLRTGQELGELVRRTVKWRGRIHPATRVFQAIRIKVNEELEELEKVLKKIPELLHPKGRVVFISFHSLEDRLIKHRFKELAHDLQKGKTGPLVILTRKPVMASPEEVDRNPRSRSAKLRAAERA